MGDWRPAVTISQSGEWVVRPTHGGAPGGTIPDEIDGSGGEIRIDVDELPDPDPVGEAMETIALHELGHALGIRRHLQSGLMAASTPWSFNCIDPAAIQALCSVRSCAPNYGPTCPGYPGSR